METMTMARPRGTPIPTAEVRDDPRLARIYARDESADGKFWYSVATTGVYCRPSCPSRTAKAANIAFHDSIADARAAGFRPCKRCDPDGPGLAEKHVALVEEACRLIEASHDEPRLNDLAAAVGLSPSHFHRLFKSITGLTPKAYARANRARRLRDGLTTESSVTAAIYDAGYGSSGRFYEESNDMLGMTPTNYRAGGTTEQLHFAVGQSSLGAVLAASSDKGVAAILLGDDPDELVRDLQDRFPKAELIGADRDYEDLVAQVVGLVEDPSLATDLPLDIRGTAFQQRVWEALRAVPAGSTATYAEIAERIGAPQSVRAVAGACAANRLAVAIPCHRVVRSDGALSGYAWGVERKRELLARESGRALFPGR